MRCNLKENTKGKLGENLVSIGEESVGHMKKKLGNPGTKY